MVRLTKPVRDYSTRREQWRLLLLIVPLGIVLVLMVQLRNPEVADRINRMFAPIEHEDQTGNNTAIAAPERRKSRIIAAEVLKPIQDNSYFRNIETAAWFQFIDALQNTPAETAAAEAVEAKYIELVDQPGIYRGRFVIVRGQVRQVTRQTPAANELGLKSYYRVVIQPADGANWPILVYCLELPVGLAEGDDLAGSMRATGLFFKNLSYRWQDGLGIAPVILANTVALVDVDSMEQAEVAQPPIVVPDAKVSSQAANIIATSFPEILAIAGWDAERFARLEDGEALSTEQQREAVELLRRLRTFDSADIAAWTEGGPVTSEVLADPDGHRGQLVQLRGRVTKAARYALDAAEAERLEMQAYYKCELSLEDSDNTITILTTRIPQAWLELPELDEPATAVSLYLRRKLNDHQVSSLWLAKEIAWYPTAIREPWVSLGMSLLGKHGMDVGLLDGIESRGRIRGGEREAFYQMLAAASRVSADQLIRFATDNLKQVREAWEKELASTTKPSRHRMAQEVVDRADAGHYSVAPLFNVPSSLIGELVVFDGVVRRVSRVEAAPQDVSGSDDLARRLGIEYYYEIELFTEDSQNYPLVFCVCELPSGFPTSGSVHVPVRVAGFFFKAWLYRVQGPADAAASGGRPQFAPLLIGRGPLVLTVEQGGESAQYILAGIFVAVLLGIWAFASWSARCDRQFRDRALSPRFLFPEGEMLDEAKIAAVDEPMKD